MALPLPIRYPDDDINDLFEYFAKQYPLSRKHMKIESPNVVGDIDQPAFGGTWVNFDTTTFRGARFWKDPMGLVYIEGLVKNGAVPSTVFTLPVRYRPNNALRFATFTSTGAGYFDVAATGNVVAQSGGNGWFSINCSFKQES